MTRGHYHLDRRYGEVYLGLSGTGLLLMWDGENKPYFEEVEEGSVHIIDGKYAHRLINTGNTQLKVVAIWSKHAGHNYEEIEERIFPVRVFKRNNGIEIEDIDG